MAKYTLDETIDKKIDSYSNMIGEKTKSKTLVKILEDFFKDKILTKDFIELEEPYYFNMNELLKEHTVKAYPKQPLENRINIYSIKKIPNNLDSLDVELESYYYGNDISIHRGIYIFYDLSSKPVPIPLVFEYNSEKKEIIIVYVPDVEDLIDYIENEADVETLNAILEPVLNIDDVPIETFLKDYFDVIENVGRLNRVKLTYTVGNDEKTNNIKSIIHSNDIGINKPIEALIEESEKKSKTINNYKKEAENVKKIISKKEESKEDILKYYSGKSKED